MSPLFELSCASRVSDLKWILSIRQWIEMLTGRRPTDTDLNTRDDLISLKMAQKQFRTVHWTAMLHTFMQRGMVETFVYMYRAPTDFCPLRHIFVHFCGLPTAFMLHVQP